MTVITDEQCTGYHQAGHPERPQRVTETVKLLRSQTDLALDWTGPAEATDEAILRAHTPEMLSRLNVEQDFDGDTPYFDHIANHARRSVGAGLEAMRLALEGKTAFSLMRPPGHHATRTRTMGFCYLNNIAIATLAALHSGAKRVVVFDFDVHHGNGTEDILLNQPGTAFYSVHQYPAYPGSGKTNVADNCFNFTVPPQVPREHYRSTLAAALGALRQFKPDLIAVSAGFDGYARDPLASGSLELEDFHWLGQSIRAFDVPAFSLLEGGYSSKLPELILAYLMGVDGK